MASQTFKFINSAVQYVALAGQEEWTGTPGTFTWVVPNGVYSICAVCIGGGGGGASSGATNSAASGGGGGGLTWGNNIPVTPGQTLTVVVGAGGAGPSTQATGGNGGESYIANSGGTRLIGASGGQGGQFGNGITTSQIGGSYTAQSGATYSSYAGGAGVTLATTPSTERPTGGGGAGGYSGVGGNGANTVNSSGNAGTGGGGGGGGGGTGTAAGGGGGGVYPYGEGSSGAAGPSNLSATGGSGGQPTSSIIGYSAKVIPGIWSPPQYSIWGQHGGEFGGGGGASPSNNPGFTPGWGCRGCVRILWGVGRAFPNTNVDNYNGSTIGPAGQSNFTTAGTQTFTVPANVTYVGAVCVGGGGAGGQGLAQSNSSASGGGGGLAWGNFEVVPGESFTVVIGAAGQSTGTNTQTSGTSSYITRNVSFKGFISGTNLFITEVLSGIITTGINITGAGVTATSIDAFQTGEYGKEGTYTIGVSQTIGTLASSITFSGTIIIMVGGGGGAAGGSGGGFVTNTNIFPSGLNCGGGSGGNSTTGSTGSTIRGAPGGGAGGYGGNGGSALRTTASASQYNGVYPSIIGSGASTSASSGATARAFGGGGGGTGIFGWGKDGGADARGSISSPALNAAGLGGSGGTNGSAPAGTGQGGNYGGGGGGQGNAYVSGSANGGGGAVRIVWGKGRVYPNYVPDV